ncbi:MAG: phosphoribosyltransferase [Candidatus Omnitrophica bacterium]|nr:phosphoribosyltransferase [Candidatus Omnitrophota bacterium]
MPTIQAKLRILSRSQERFRDRKEAGRLLTESLCPYKDPHMVVVGIPRGGLVVAREVAYGLDVTFDIALSTKLGAPSNPEFAIGAVNEVGEMFMDQALIRHLGLDERYLIQEAKQRFAEIRRRSSIYRNVCPKMNLKGRDVLLIDDGIATGSTVQAALWSIRREEPRKLVGVFPVGPEQVLQQLSETADEIICLRVPEMLGSVGRFYNHFEQISDIDILEILKECEGNE